MLLWHASIIHTIHNYLLLFRHGGSFATEVHLGLLNLLPQLLFYLITLSFFFLLFSTLDLILQSNFLFLLFLDFILLLLYFLLILHHFPNGHVALLLLFLILHFLSLLKECLYTIYWLQRWAVMLSNICLVALFGWFFGLGCSLLGNSKDVFHRNVL